MGIRVARYLTAVVLWIVVASPVHAADNFRSVSRLADTPLAIKKHARPNNLDGYKSVSLNSSVRCRETLRGTLECRQ